MNKIAKRWFTGIVSALAFCAIGFGVNHFQNDENAVLTVSAAETISTDITMQETVQLRTYTSGGTLVGTEKPALRFAIRLSDAAAQNVINGESRVGILVSTSSILKGCTTGDYYTYMETQKGYRAEARSADHLVYVDDAYYLRFSLTDISFNYLDETWSAIGYVRDASTNEILSYTDMSGEYDVEYVASKALVDGNTFTYFDSSTNTTTTPVIDWVQQATYKKYGVSYDKTAENERYYTYNGNTYTYAELQNAVNINEAAAKVYPMQSFTLANSMLVGEQHALGNDSGVNIQYKSSNESVLTVTDSGTVTAVGAGTAYITATIGNTSAGNAVSYSTDTVTVSAHSTPSLAQLASGYTYNWHTNYMNVVNDGGSKATRYETSFSNCSGIALYLNAGNNWWLDGLSTGVNLALSSSSGYNNKYTITLHANCSAAGLIHLQSVENGSIVTYDTATVDAGEQTVTFTYVGSSTRLGIYTSADMGLGYLDLARADVSSASKTTNPFGDTTSAYTWNITDGDFVSVADNCEYIYVSTLTDQNLRKTLTNTGYFGDNYALRVYPGSGGYTTLSFATGKTSITYAWTVSFTAYAAGGSPCLSMYDDSSGTRKDKIFNATSLGNGMYEYTISGIFDGDDSSDRMWLYGQTGTDIWISSMTVLMYRRELGAEYAFDIRIFADDIINQREVHGLGTSGANYNMTVSSEAASNSLAAAAGYSRWVQIDCYGKNGDILADLIWLEDWIENWNQGAFSGGGTIRLYWYQTQGWSANCIYLTKSYYEGSASFEQLAEYANTGMCASEHDFPADTGNRLLLHAKSMSHTIFLCEIRLTGVTRPWVYV